MFKKSKSDDVVCLLLAGLSGYHVPDLSKCAPLPSNVPAFGSPEYKEAMARFESEVANLGESEERLTHDKPLVFADKAHESVYDRQYREYVESLGEQAEPETTESSMVEPDKRFKLVGQGEATGPYCGQFVRWMGCSDVANHNFSTLQGGNFAGKVDMHPIISHCCRPSCPLCYSKGWSMREANIITQRMEAVEFGYVDKKDVRHSGLGRAEHIIISAPQSDYGLSYEELKAKVLKVAFSRGIIGGVMIWHPMRYRKFDVIRGGIRNMRGWFFAPHYHIIGYFASGVNYSKCRNCSKMRAYEKVTGSGKVVKRIGNVDVCKGCDGFECKVRILAWGSNMKPNVDGSAGFWVDAKGKEHLGDKYIVKVQEYRKSIFATAAYQLNHAGYMIGAKRFSPETWFGTMSYRKLSVTVEKRKSLCRICNNDLVPHKYVGKVLMERFEGLPNRPEILDLMEVGVDGNSFPAWVVDKDEIDKLAKDKFSFL